MNELKTVSISASGIRASDLAKLLEKFRGRYYFRQANGSDILVIKAVDYDEFIFITQIVQVNFASMKLLYRYAEESYNKHTIPHEDIFIYRG